MIHTGRFRQDIMDLLNDNPPLQNKETRTGENVCISGRNDLLPLKAPSIDCLKNKRQLLQSGLDIIFSAQFHHSNTVIPTYV